MTTVFSKAWVDIADTAVDPDSPVDTVLMTGIRDCLVNLHEQMGADYYAGAKPNHIHDGIGSALIAVGPNLLRNGSFESDPVGAITALTSWTLTPYTGGSAAISNTAAHGAQSLAITSTVLANGGGDVLSDEFIAVGENDYVPWQVMVWASVANVSGEVDVDWYDASKTLISTTPGYSSSNLPTTPTLQAGISQAPATAAYMKFRYIGGIPATGTAVGTVYFDGGYASVNIDAPILVGGSYGSLQNGSNGNTSYSETLNWRVLKSGTYRVKFYLTCSTYGAASTYARIYKNGVAYGTARITGTAATFTQDLYFNAGDTVQIYAYVSTAGYYATVINAEFGVSTALRNIVFPVPCAVGDR